MGGLRKESRREYWNKKRERGTRRESRRARLKEEERTGEASREGRGQSHMDFLHQRALTHATRLEFSLPAHKTRQHHPHTKRSNIAPGRMAARAARKKREKNWPVALQAPLSPSCPRSQSEKKERNSDQLQLEILREKVGST
eukprot:1067665-Rhodomonas_salina.2